VPGGQPLHAALHHYYCEFDAIALLERFAVRGQAPERGIVRNFLGVRIPTSVHPPVLAAMAGTVEGLPIPGNWHADIAEWAAALRAVDCAEETFRIVELGCGWGCWMVNTGVAARARGLAVELIGVEGEAQHLQSARRTLRLNGFDRTHFRLHHAVAGPAPGLAIFPRAAPGSAGWGGEAVFRPSPDALAAARDRPDVQVLKCLTLSQLARGRRIDLLHIDIQGAEVDFVRANMEQMRRSVRRVLIGTHGRVIEGALMTIFQADGWALEMERPAIMPLQAGRPQLAIDGVQMWRNPAEAEPGARADHAGR
jgi:FkbM family methyltransferase